VTDADWAFLEGVATNNSFYEQLFQETALDQRRIEIEYIMSRISSNLTESESAPTLFEDFFRQAETIQRTGELLDITRGQIRRLVAAVYSVRDAPETVRELIAAPAIVRDMAREVITRQIQSILDIMGTGTTRSQESYWVAQQILSRQKTGIILGRSAVLRFSEREPQFEEKDWSAGYPGIYLKKSLMRAEKVRKSLLPPATSLPSPVKIVDTGAMPEPNPAHHTEQRNTEDANDEFPESELWEVGASELGKQAVQTFRRDLSRLLEERPGEWVAYHGTQRIGIAKTDQELYRKCATLGIPDADYIVRSIEPEPPDVIYLD
jgi:hypothetical protein